MPATPQFFPAQNPEQLDRIIALQRQQQLAQQLMENGKMPDSNEMAGQIVVRHSPLEYLAKGLSTALGSSQNLEAQKNAMQLQADQYGAMFGGGAGGPSAGGTGPGISNNDLMKISMTQKFFGDDAAKALADSMALTNEQKNASASGKSNPLDYANALEGGKAQYAPPVHIQPVPGGPEQLVRPDILAKNLGGDTSSPPSPAIPSMPMQSTPYGMGGDALPAMSAGAGAPNPGPVSAQPLSPPQGVPSLDQANIGQVNPGAPGMSLPPASGLANGAPMPLQGGGSPVVQGGIQTASPQQNLIAQETALAPIRANQKLSEANATGAQKFADDLNADATQALAEKRSLAQMRDYFSDFTPGKQAGLQQAIAQYKIATGIGTPEDAKIAAATEGVDKQAASLALMQMKALNSSGGANGNGNRVEFNALLQNTPNIGLSPLGAKSIMDFMDKGTDIPIQRQQDYNEFIKTNSPLDYQKFNAQYNNKTLQGIPASINNMPTGSAQKGAVSAPITKVINGVTYTNINGQWHGP